MRGLKELPHSCFSFLLQISSEPFSVKDYQLIQYLIPVPVSLRPLFDYVLAGKIQHLFQCRIAWEYAFRFRDFPILAVQSFYDICRVHNASDIIRKLEKGTYIFPIIFPVADSIGIFLSPFLLNVLQFFEQFRRITPEPTTKVVINSDRTRCETDAAVNIRPPSPR